MSFITICFYVVYCKVCSTSALCAQQKYIFSQEEQKLKNNGFIFHFMLTCNRHSGLSVVQTDYSVAVQTEVTADGLGFEHRAAVSESSLSIELSAGEVVRPAFDEQIKRSAGTLAFTLPSFQPLNQEGTFQMMPVCLSVFFGQTNPALCKPCYSV